MQHFGEDAISTEYSALRSTVVWNGARVVQPINEPAPGKRKSQIEEYLDYYRAPGVQHVAIRTDDIVATVAALQARGTRFLRVPDEYYDEAPGRMGEMGAGLPWEQLAALGILVDRDPQGYLLQIFTENVASRPTVFLEIIQRAGASGFGEGNFKALFVSLEAEQRRRGNL
jgi:4-hydroxyphenylpyruvate dioxygenase